MTLTTSVGDLATFAAQDYPIFTDLPQSSGKSGQFGEIAMQDPASSLSVSGAAADTARLTMLHKKSVDLEAGFLSEMLKYSGLDSQNDAFSGGEGEEQFSSFLRDSYAQKMAKAGGIGLSESIFRSLAKDATHG